jgi:D-alanyl-D-alanine carboxypeptidase
MAAVDFGARSGLRYGLLASAAVAAALTVTGDVADARRHHYRGHAHHAHAGGSHHRHARSEDYSPPFASIVVDGNNDAVLQAASADALRHPASLTKVMTLYLLFERLESGRLKLDSPLKVSEHAAEQAPTKLALKPGQTITVEDAIKGIVTKSANDAAVAVAETLGGDEDSFAKLMTQKAHALGMTHTTYVNASGLPDDDQVTTARDQALLGRAIQERFPRYYRYFSTETFVYHGESMRNHNHLLGAVDGVDGIKTGFTRASGFNLLTSLHREGRYLVAVVMGGPSASERDERMRELLRAHIKEAAVRRTAPVIAEVAEREPARKPAALHVDRKATATIESRWVGSNDPIRPVLVKTISYRTAPVQTAPLAPMPALVPVGAPASPAQAQAAQPAAPTQATMNPQTRVEIASAATPSVATSVPPSLSAASPPPAVPSAAAAPAVSVAPTMTPSAGVKAVASAEPPPAGIKVVEAAPAKSAETAPVHMQPLQIEPAPAEPRVIVPTTAPAQAYVGPAAHSHGGWLIQIGAFDDEGQAKQHLTAAQLKVHGTLATKDPFTERIQKGDKALYRARFAGFDKATAEAACKALKRSDFECMPLRD